jgi:hypothetical protein
VWQMIDVFCIDLSIVGVCPSRQSAPHIFHRLRRSRMLRLITPSSSSTSWFIIVVDGQEWNVSLINTYIQRPATDGTFVL